MPRRFNKFPNSLRKSFKARTATVCCNASQAEERAPVVVKPFFNWSKDNAFSILDNYSSSMSGGAQ